MSTRKPEDYQRIVKEFRQYFSGPTSDLVKYLINNNIMTAKEIAKQMGVSRETLYNKYINK